jgi:dipeptidyl aminopeptidase/acylaminoacyl peptidase
MMKRNLASAFLALLISIFAHSVNGQRAWTPADTLRVAGVGDAQISPDGDWVVYTVSTTEDNATRTTLWLASLNRLNAILERERLATDARIATEPLLPAGLNASNPRWSPDGKRIAFLASKDKQSGIWVVTLRERQPRFVAPVRATNFFITYAGEAFAWSPDSRRIAFISATEESTTLTAPITTPRTSSRDEKADDPRIVDRIQYKSRTSFSDRARTHVWVVDVDSSPTDDAAIRQLTSGQFYDHALTWNPRGDEVAFLSNHEADADANNNSDIFAVDMQGRVRQLTETRGCEYEPAWSPDGKWIAYTATKRDVTTIDSVAEDTHVWVIDAGGNRSREISAALDRRARSPHWMPDSKALLFIATDKGQSRIFRVNLDGRSLQALTIYNPGTLRNWMWPEHFASFEDYASQASIAQSLRIKLQPTQITGFSLSKASFTTEVQSLLSHNLRRDAESTPRLAYILSDPLHPAEVWLRYSRLTAAQRLSAHNHSLVNSLTLVAPEEIKFTSSDGTEIQGWLMKPVGWRADRRYPLILSIHGGPHGMYGYGFNATFQAYAARGYAVLYMNPRGSNGYGQKFSDGTLREWGGGDYRDLMMGVDEVLRTRSWIDADRLGVTGGSYGGFMTNWIITQTTRFKSAVASASVSNLISFYSTSLYQDLVHAEFGGFPWDDYDQLWRWSPLRYVKQAQTPTLLIHGEQDNDVHITQAEEMYMALKRRGVETVLARYPREGHGFREPLHRLDALERTLAWFDRFLK